MPDRPGDDPALSFGRVADVYERARPGYPEAALDWLLPAGARRVADVGAGTGKLTRQLVARGLDVTAVEPDGEMRLRLERQVPGARPLAGRGEQLPVPDAALDAVLFAQSWHWVDPAAASVEAGRVLASGGRLCLLWNLRDGRLEWLAELQAVLTAAGSPPQDRSVPPTVTTPFTTLEHIEVPWLHRSTPEALVELVASRSYVITLPPERRAVVLAQVRDLVTSHPDLAGRDVVEVPYRTHCFRAVRP